jgi:hypothetical protein
VGLTYTPPSLPGWLANVNPADFKHRPAQPTPVCVATDGMTAKTWIDYGRMDVIFCVTGPDGRAVADCFCEAGEDDEATCRDWVVRSVVHECPARELLTELVAACDKAAFWQAVGEFRDERELSRSCGGLVFRMRQGCRCDSVQVLGPDGRYSAIGPPPHWGCRAMTAALGTGEKDAARLRLYHYAAGTRERQAMEAIASGGRFVPLSELRAAVAAVCAPRP